MRQAQLSRKSRAARGGAVAVAAVLGLLALMSPALAAAQTCRAPQGIAGLEEYCESVPGAGGDRGPRDLDPGGRGAGPHDLARLVGKPGARQLLGFAQRDVERPGRSGAPGTGNAGETTIGSIADDGFLWILGGVILALVVVAGMRYLRRSGRRSPDPQTT
jgi:hypothetical protein